MVFIDIWTSLVLVQLYSLLSHAEITYKACSRRHLIYCYAKKKNSRFEFFLAWKPISFCLKYDKKLKKSQKWSDFKKSFCRIETFDGSKFRGCKTDSNFWGGDFRHTWNRFKLLRGWFCHPWNWNQTLKWVILPHLQLVTIFYFPNYLVMVRLLACSVAIIHSQRLHFFLTYSPHFTAPGIIFWTI